MSIKTDTFYQVIALSMEGGVCRFQKSKLKSGPYGKIRKGRSLILI